MDAQELFIKPAQGLRVLDPQDMKPLAEAGELKPMTPYWLRRLAEGDVMAGAVNTAEAKTTNRSSK